jgi:SAM-dependent methyltransferase
MSSGEELRCAGAGHVFPIRDGVPRFATDTTDTAKHFGYMWGEQAAAATPPAHVMPYHLEAMRDALAVPPLKGLILDAGCGEGIDLSQAALDPECEVIGVELSSGGVATSLARVSGNDRAHVVQGDLLKIPLAEDTFDAAYSYGVVHHTPDPARAICEIARTLKPGAPLLYYVYEDFADRSLPWRAALATANSVRVLTTRMPPAALMRVCRLLSPVVYLFCTLPSRHFRWAAQFPYRHGTDPWSMSGDLFDRLSAPIEQRYSADSAAGLAVERVAQRRGWMVLARTHA